MSIKSLLEPIVENGIKNTNFFEGRLLTGRDLREQETADREHRRQLGRAIGAGIVEGLEVEIDKDADIDTIQAGQRVSVSSVEVGRFKVKLSR